MFSNITFSQDMIGDKKKMERLLKFDNVSHVFEVGKALRASNQNKVAKALEKSVDIENIESNVRNCQVLYKRSLASMA